MFDLVWVFWFGLVKIENTQTLLDKIRHRFQVKTKLYTG